MAGSLRQVAMRRPGGILSADAEAWHYAKALDCAVLVAQYEAFVELVIASGAHIHWLPADDSDGLADSVFTYDPLFVIPEGGVILRPGKLLRRAEADLHRAFYEGMLPILGGIEAPGVIEASDCCWLDATTLEVGRGFRTNQSGIDQPTAIVERHGIAVEA